MKTAFIAVVTMFLVFDFMLRIRDFSDKTNMSGNVALVALSINGIMVVWGVAAFFA